MLTVLNYGMIKVYSYQNSWKGWIKLIKKLLCKRIFKKEFDDEMQRLKSNFQEEKRQLMHEMNKCKMKYGIVERVFELFPNSEIVGIKANNIGDELIIVINDGALYLFGEKYQGILGLPRIFFEFRYINSGPFPIKYIHITDVLMKDDNIGNGSIAMEALIKYAKKNDVKWIEGYLSPVDDDHTDRRNHYYEKFGFKIEKSTVKLEI